MFALNTFEKRALRETMRNDSILQVAFAKCPHDPVKRAFGRVENSSPDRVIAT